MRRLTRRRSARQPLQCPATHDADFDADFTPRKTAFANSKCRKGTVEVSALRTPRRQKHFQGDAPMVAQFHGSSQRQLTGRFSTLRRGFAPFQWRDCPRTPGREGIPSGFPQVPFTTTKRPPGWFGPPGGIFGADLRAAKTEIQPCPSSLRRCVHLRCDDV